MTDLHQILFLDIETVSQHSDYNLLTTQEQKLWEDKTAFLSRHADHLWTKEDFAAAYAQRAAIYAEFGKVIVISTGNIQFSENGPMLYIRSFFGHTEHELLSDFAIFMNESFNQPNTHILCGHNIREFDIPYLCRRMTVHQIPLPALFKISGKKPWEVKHLADTLELWRFGDFKNYTSLNLLTHVLDIPSSKDDLDGSKVGHAYWQEQNLESIKNYCERDVLAVAQVYLRLNQKPLLDEDQVIKAHQSTLV